MRTVFNELQTTLGGNEAVYFCSFNHSATFLNIGFEDMSTTGTIIFSLVSIVGWYFGMVE
jgi:hypothetical protein